MDEEELARLVSRRRKAGLEQSASLANKGGSRYGDSNYSMANAAPAGAIPAAPVAPSAAPVSGAVGASSTSASQQLAPAAGEVALTTPEVGCCEQHTYRTGRRDWS
jgi:hypothetical protein